MAHPLGLLVERGPIHGDLTLFQFWQLHNFLSLDIDHYEGKCVFVLSNYASEVTDIQKANVPHAPFLSLDHSDLFSGGHCQEHVIIEEDAVTLQLDDI